MRQAANDRRGKPAARVGAHREQVRAECANPVPECRIGLIVCDFEGKRQGRRDLLDDRSELQLFLLAQPSVGCVSLLLFVRRPLHWWLPGVDQPDLGFWSDAASPFEGAPRTL